MAVNENVYGDKNLWHNAFFQQSTLVNKNKLPYFDVNRTTLLDGTRANKLSFSKPIDKSISYCGLGTECALSHIAYTNFVNGNVEITDIQDRDVTNFGFFEKNNTVQYISNSSAFYYDNINWIKWDNDYAELTNYQRLLSPLTLVNPHNVVLAINVSAYDSNMSDHITTSLYNYMQYNTSSHPNIERVTIQPFYGDISLTSQRDIYGSQGNVTYRIPFQLGILDEYQMPSKNVNFYSYGLDGFPVFGNVQNVPYTYNSINVFGMVLHTENSLPHIKIVHSTNDITYVYTEYYPEFEQDIMKTVACFGLYFSPIVSTAREGSLTNNYMYIGLLDENGIGHGQYLRGSETVNAPQNSYSDMSETGYDYTKSVDPNTYSDKTKFGNFTNSLLSSYAYYVAPLTLITGLLSPTLSALSEVASYPEPTNKWLFDSSFVFQEPIECILAWRKIFFKPATLNGSLHNISIGWFTTQNATSQAYISQIENERYLLADIEIYPRYGDFRDYEPYTTMALFVPYCGMKELPLATFMGHHMQLYLIKNYRTGTLEILIMVDNKYWGNMTGNASIEFPLSGNKSMEYIKSRMEIEQQIEDTMMNSFSSMVGNAAGATISLAHGNPAGALIQAGAGVLNAIQGVDKVANLDYQLDHLANKIVNIQKGSTSTTPCEILYPYILIKRPRMMTGFDEDIYSKTIGYATLENKMKNSLKGYIEATSPLLDGIPCTDTERKLIVKALEEGCIFDEE